MKQAGLCLFFCIIFGLKVIAQPGCSDPQASNFNVAATSNNGSCVYGTTTYKLPIKTSLPDALQETSGLVFTDDKLWTHNDSGGEPAIYHIDTLSGQVRQTVVVTNTVNTDWEAITADNQYIYVGDFGNNRSGNRQDLVIYRIRKSDIGTVPAIRVRADLIRFSYSDQTDFMAKELNRTAFDCEAMFVQNGQLHLFTKDWIGDKTRHYTLPATPGVHKATFREQLAANGLITDAALSETGVLVLTGYTRVGAAFLWLLFDYADERFFGGNKRRIELGLALDKGQIEGVAFRRNYEGFIASEKFSSVSPTLYTFTVGDWVYHNPTATETDTLIQLYPNPVFPEADILLNISEIQQGEPIRLRVLDQTGKSIYQNSIFATAKTTALRLPYLPSGLYIVRIQTRRWNRNVKLIIRQ